MLALRADKFCIGETPTGVGRCLRVAASGSTILVDGGRNPHQSGEVFASLLLSLLLSFLGRETPTGVGL
jgi:hypothetical protein